MNEHAHDLGNLRALLDRLARVAAAEDWSHDLNPTQSAVLGYLLRANRFSRSPSNVADYLGTTRGTVSQSLKSLQKKGYVEETRLRGDRRSISYDVTPNGQKLFSVQRDADRAIDSLSAVEKAALEATLTKALLAILRQRGLREFGKCRTCRYHDLSENRPFCKLLSIELEDGESERICHEHVSLIQDPSSPP